MCKFALKLPLQIVAGGVALVTVTHLSQKNLATKYIFMQQLLLSEITFRSTLKSMPVIKRMITNHCDFPLYGSIPQ